MTRSRKKVMSLMPPQTADDFTQIQGIGSVTQKRLHASGISTFAQLAKLSPEAVSGLIPHLSVSNIVKQSWINQARELALTKANCKTLPTKSTPPTNRQYYENFTLEFLLGEKNKIRRVQIISVQSGDIDTFKKWDPERLIDFLAHHTGLRLRYAKSSHKNNMELTQAPLSYISSEQQPETKVESSQVQPIAQLENQGLAQVIKPAEIIPETYRTPDTPPSISIHQRQPATAVSASAVHEIRLLEWETCLAGTNYPVSHLTHDQAFDIHLSIDLCSSDLPKGSHLSLGAAIYAKELGKGPRQMIAKAQLTKPYANSIDLIIENMGLPGGLYRLDALLTIHPINTPASSRFAVTTSIPGSLIQVY